MNREITELFAKQSKIFQQFLHPLTDQRREELIVEMSQTRANLEIEIEKMFRSEIVVNEN